MAKPARITAYSVAKASGVSQATVSYVLNDTPGQTISEETKRRVLAAVAELGYRPLEAARTLSTGQSNLALFLIPDFPIGHVMSELMDHVANRLSSRGKTLITFRVPRGVSLNDVTSTIAPWAVISLIPLEESDIQFLRAAGITTEVLGFTDPETAKSGLVSNPQEKVGRLQVDHLASRGHRRLAFAQPSDPRFESFSVPRYEGVRQASEDAGLTAPETLIVGLESRPLVEELTRLTQDGVTGICAYNDEVAIEVLAAARTAKIRVPDQLAVVGVDDIPVARFVEPSLTTVLQDMNHVAAELVTKLFRDDAAKKGAAEASSVVEDVSRIIIRESA